MWGIWITIAVVVVILILFIVSRKRAIPPVEMFKEIGDAIFNLQKKAASNIHVAQDGKDITGISIDKMQNQTLRIQDTIRFVYTIEQNGDEIIHAISSQMLKPKPRKYQLSCMLFVMLTLNKQINEAKINPDDVQFNIDQSELGTLYVNMTLTHSQHDAILNLSAVKA
jgi:hypothetical protein